jgi:hypothetical protein
LTALFFFFVANFEKLSVLFMIVDLLFFNSSIKKLFIG